MSAPFRLIRGRYNLPVDSCKTYFVLFLCTSNVYLRVLFFIRLIYLLMLFFWFAIGLATKTPITTGITPASKEIPVCMVKIIPKPIAPILPKINCLTIIFLYINGKKFNFSVTSCSSFIEVCNCNLYKG